MSNCSIVTISKIVPDKEDSVEFSKVYNTLLENSKVELYLTHMQENEPDSVDGIYELFKMFATDVVDTCYSKVKDLCIEIDYDEPLNELSLELKLLLVSGEQMMNQDFFNICIELSDKYETEIIDRSLYSMSFDFNVMLKNEYTRTITVKKNGLQ